MRGSRAIEHPVTKGHCMSRSKFLTKLSLLAFSLALGVAFAPQLVSPVHAQEGDEEEGGPELTDAQKKEIDSIRKTQAKAEESIQNKDYEAGVKIFKKLAEKLENAKLPEKITSNIQWKMWKQNARYNYACCLSRTGAKDEAVKEFVKSIDLGFM